jgi:hypothetical protein
MISKVRFKTGLSLTGMLPVISATRIWRLRGNLFRNLFYGINILNRFLDYYGQLVIIAVRFNKSLLVTYCLLLVDSN